MDRFINVVYENIRFADVILEVIDARDPVGTRNKKIEKFIVENNKILILVMNKADLVPKNIILKWNTILNREFPTIYAGKSKKFGISPKLLKKEIKQRCKKPNIKILIIGYPNVGKSTIINSLKGKLTVGTSPEAGFTRGKQFIRLSEDILLIDTPGVIPYDESDKINLVLKNALRVEKVEDPYFVVAEILNRVDKKIIETTYDIEFSDVDELLEKFARKRGKLLPGNEPNMDEAARIIIRDWQRGKIPYYFLPPIN
ncbi:MAG: YlqF/YawG family GTPase [Candidatus Helarchaeota archaeon]